MRVERGVLSKLMSDLPAIVIELLIQTTLVGLRQMTIVCLTHIMLLLVHGLDVAAILPGLGSRDLSLPTLLIDAPLLVVLTTIDLVYSGMILQVRRLMAGPLLSKTSRGKKESDGSNNKRFHDCRFF